MTVVFSTPGLIDPRAFTIGGLTAKPNSTNPIGRFGTGLKYAIASLVRMDACPIVFIGRDKYEFLKKPIEFRGKQVDLIDMHLTKWSWRKPRVYEMPFTTEYGAHWKPWMVYRELEANTRDEGGTSYQTRCPGREMTNKLGYDETVIIADLDEAYEDRDTTFLPKDREPITEDSNLQQFEGPSKYLYWRGMRVLELGKPSLYTWNFLRDMDLTEDRTLKYEFLARTNLAEWLTERKDQEFIKKMITVKEAYWESAMDFSYAYRPSVEFRAAVREAPRNEMLRSAASWADVHEPQELPEDVLHLPWRSKEDFVLDDNGKQIFMRPPELDSAEWDALVSEMCERLRK